MNLSKKLWDDDPRDRYDSIRKYGGNNSPVPLRLITEYFLRTAGVSTRSFRQWRNGVAKLLIMAVLTR